MVPTHGHILGPKETLQALRCAKWRSHPYMDRSDDSLSVSRLANSHVKGRIVNTLSYGSPSAHDGSYSSPNVIYGTYGHHMTKYIVVSFVRAPNGLM